LTEKKKKMQKQNVVLFTVKDVQLLVEIVIEVFQIILNRHIGLVRVVLENLNFQDILAKVNQLQQQHQKHRKQQENQRIQKPKKN
tara:strand:+ start:444 stop:698 length:255 start_codon:yes stop_codon:yes gene_type:complete